MAETNYQGEDQQEMAPPARERNPFVRLFNFFSGIFIWLSGASAQTLHTQCSAWEQRKYEAFGATVLVPAVFGFVASAYAVSTLTDITWIIFGFAVVWCCIILAIDRALLSSYRAYASLSKKIPQVIMRFSVAFLLGFTIAHPLTLLLFKDTIVAEVERYRGEEVEKIREQAVENKKELEDRITVTAAALADQQNRYQETISASMLQGDQAASAATDPSMELAGSESIDAQVDQATKAQKDRIAELDQQLGQYSDRYAKVQDELTHWQAEYEAELDGSRSGTAGIGPRAKSIQADQLEPRRAEAQRLGSLLQSLTAQRNDLSQEAAKIEQDIRSSFAQESAAEAAKIREDQQKVAELQRELKKKQLSIFVDQQEVLLAQIQRQIDAHTEELTRLQGEASQISADAQADIEKIQGQKRMDILIQTLALHHLFERGDEGGHFALAVYVILAALFMLIDTIPIIVKLFSNPGQYDKLQALNENDESRHKVRLGEIKREYEEEIFHAQMAAKTEIARFNSQLKVKEAEKKETERRQLLEEEILEIKEAARKREEEAIVRAEERRLQREEEAKRREEERQKLLEEEERRKKELEEQRKKEEAELRELRERAEKLRREQEEIERERRHQELLRVENEAAESKHEKSRQIFDDMEEELGSSSPRQEEPEVADAEREESLPSEERRELGFGELLTQNGNGDSHSEQTEDREPVAEESSRNGFTHGDEIGAQHWDQESGAYSKSQPQNDKLREALPDLAEHVEARKEEVAQEDTVDAPEEVAPVAQGPSVKPMIPLPDRSNPSDRQRYESMHGGETERVELPSPEDLVAAQPQITPDVDFAAEGSEPEMPAEHAAFSPAQPLAREETAPVSVQSAAEPDPQPEAAEEPTPAPAPAAKAPRKSRPAAEGERSIPKPGQRGGLKAERKRFTINASTKS